MEVDIVILLRRSYLEGAQWVRDWTWAVPCPFLASLLKCCFLFVAGFSRYCKCLSKYFKVHYDDVFMSSS